jgi:hypothetical protein
MNAYADFCVAMEGLNVCATPFVSKEVAMMNMNMELVANALYAMLDADDVVPCRKIGCSCEEGDLGKKCPFISSYEDIELNKDVASVDDDDEDSVWTDIDEDEEIDDEPECDCHEVTHAPLFQIPDDAGVGNCVICFDDIKAVNMMITRCGHPFHASCCIAALVENNGCPLCRTQLV